MEKRSQKIANVVVLVWLMISSDYCYAESIDFAEIYQQDQQSDQLCLVQFECIAHPQPLPRRAHLVGFSSVAILHFPLYIPVWLTFCHK